MKACKLLFVSFAAFAAVMLPPAAHALVVQVWIHLGPTIIGPDDGTLILSANPGDMLRIDAAPEPSTSLLLGAELADLVGFGRKRRS